MRTQVQLASPRAQRPAPLKILLNDTIDFRVHVSVGIERKPATGSEQQTSMFRRLGQKAFDQLQAKRQGVADQDHVLVALIDRPARGQGVSHLVHRKPLDRARRSAEQDQGQAGENRDLVRHGSFQDTVTSGDPVVPVTPSYYISSFIAVREKGFSSFVAPRTLLNEYVLVVAGLMLCWFVTTRLAPILEKLDRPTRKSDPSQVVGMNTARGRPTRDSWGAT